MNHIYKVIWNKAKHCYTVVSEIAKSHKNSSNGGSNKKAAALAVALSLACCYGVVSVEAQITETASDYDIEIGKIKTVKDDHDNPAASPYVTKADMAIGKSSVAKGSHSTAIGNQSNVDGDYSLAIGYNSKIIKGSSSMAIGNSSEAHDTATAVGAQSYAASSATAIGMNSKSTAMGGVSIGVSSMVGNAGGIAIGRAAKNVSSDGTNQKSGIAIGDFSNAQGEQSFAIGPSANALGNYSIAFGEGARTESGTTWATVLGHASTIGKNATYSTIIGSLSSISEGATWSTIIGANSSISGNANNSTAVGGYTKVSASCGTALGTSSAVTAENGTALGGFSSVTAKDGVAIGDVSKADRAAGERGYLADTDTTDSTWRANQGAVSVGSSVAKLTRQITNVAAGSEDTDAVNVAQLKKVASQAAASKTTVSDGTNTTVTSTTVAEDGHTDYRVNLNKDLTGIESMTNGSSSIRMGNGGTVTINNKVTIDQSGKISGVAAGEISSTSTDAVNGSQLHAVQQEAGKHTKVVNGSNITVEETDQDGQKTYKVGLKKDLLLGDITGKNVRISGTDGTIETTGSITTKDKIYAANGAKLADIDIKGDTISNVQSSGSKGQSKIVLNEANTGMAYGDTNVVLRDNGVYLNGKVNVDKAGQIHNVTAGTADEDAVNVSQLNKQAAASKTTVSDGTNTTVTSTVAKDGHTDYKVNLNKDLTGIESISNGSKGQSKIVLNEAYTGMAYGDTNVVLRDNGVYLNGKVNVDKAGQIHNVTAGTADEDAVNVSQLKKQTAASKTTVSDGTNTTVTSTVAKDGHTDYKVNLNKDLTGIESISNGSKGQSKIVLNEGYAGMSYGATNVVLRDNGVYLNGKVNVDKAGQIHNVTAGTADEDAVNVSQLKKQAAASKTTVSDGTNTTVTSTVAEDGHTDYKVNLNKDLTGIESMTNGLSSIRMGNGGTVTINNRVTIDQSGKISGVAAGEVKEGSTDAVNGSQLKGVENKADKNAENIQKNTEAIAKNTADISKNAEAISKNTENIKNNSKAIAENAKNIQKNTEAIAKNTADISKNTEAIGKLDERVTSVEEVAKKHTTVSTDDKNVQISEDTNKDGGKDYKVSLNKDLNLSSVTTGDTKMDTNGVTVKDVSLTKDGLSIGNKTYVSNKGLNANDQKVTNVAAGDLSEKSTDAVNGSQLFATNQQVVQNAQSISKLGNRINKVGAGAAALAALHPLDFDPDDKWDIAAGYGNYNGENAAAIGAYYRPNEDTMFSVGGSFGNGENMVNAGVSLKLGQGNHVSTSKVAMAKEIKDLRKELEGLKSALLDANAGKKLDTSKLQLFPDVPKNHWAYEYVSTLKGNGVLTGYPDGEFKGDRPMTRYEFATMLYKAMLEGATLSDKILKEFAPELERFTVDTVHQDKDGKPTVERVRTVKAEK